MPRPHMRPIRVLLLALACAAVMAAEPPAMPTLQRIGHTDVWVLAKDDAAANPHAYYSVRFVGDGLLAASSIWESPTIFRLDPQSGLCDVVSYFRPVKGNEDNRRWSLRVSALAPREHLLSRSESRQTFLFWHVDGYEDLDGDATNGNKDTGLFVAPLDVTKPFFSDVKITTTNLPPDQSVGRGPTRRGIAYDPRNRLLFASISRGKNPNRDDILQVFRFNRTSGSLFGRTQVFEPSDVGDATEFSFVDVDPQHRVVMLGGGLRWQTHGARLYLARYFPNRSEPEACAVENVQRRTQLRIGDSGPASRLLQDPRCAAFAERNGRLWAIVGSGRFDRTHDPAEFSDGLWTFDLGPAGGPYEFGQPTARVPFNSPVEHVLIDGERVLASSRGVRVWRLDDLLGARGLATDVRPTESVPLPYRTHELDIDLVGGQRVLVVASGERGFDLFRWVLAEPPSNSPVAAKPRRVSVGDKKADVLLETGESIRQLGPPSLANHGVLAVWAILADGREAVLTRKSGSSEWQIAVASGNDGRRTLNLHPSLTTADDLVCWAGCADGTQTIVRWQSGIATTALRSAAASEKTPDPFFLDPPVLSASGTVLFGAEPASGRYTLFRLHENRAEPLLPDAPSLYFAPDLESFNYDISPEGIVTFIAQTDREDWATTGAYVLQDGRLEPVTGPAAKRDRNIGAQRHIRAGKRGDFTLQSFVDEIVAFRTISRAGVPSTIVRHRSSAETRVPLAYVGPGITNAHGISVLLAWPAADGVEPGSQGHGLYRALLRRSQVELLFRFHQIADGQPIREIQFHRGYNDSGHVAATLKVRGPNGQLRQILIDLDLGL